MVTFQEGKCSLKGYVCQSRYSPLLSPAKTILIALSFSPAIRYICRFLLHNPFPAFGWIAGSRKINSIISELRKMFD